MPGGATWTGRGANFSLFSASATRVEFCLFDDSGETKLERIELPEYTNEIWHGFLPDARRGHGLRIPRARPLTRRTRDIAYTRSSSCSPYATAVVGQSKWGPEIFGYQMESIIPQPRERGVRPQDDLTFEERDSAPLCRSAGSSIPPLPGATTAPEWNGQRKGIARRLR
jgi:isoamylase